MKTKYDVTARAPWRTTDGEVTAEQACAWFDALPDVVAARAALGVGSNTDRRWDVTAQKFRAAGLVRSVRIGRVSTFERVPA